MTSLGKFLLRHSEEDLKLYLGAAAIVVVAGAWIGTSIYRADMREHSVIAEPLYGSSLREFIETLDQKPEGKTDSLRLNKASDRFMADIVRTSMKALDVDAGTVTLPDSASLDSGHVSVGRYAAVKKMDLDIRTFGRHRIGVREWGPQAAEKLAAVKETVSRFDELAAAVRRSDIEGAKSSLQKVQASLETYLLKYHSKEHDLDRASADLRRLDRQLDAMMDEVVVATAAATTGNTAK